MAKQSMSEIVSRFLKFAKRGMSAGVCEVNKRTPKFCVEACIFMAHHPEIQEKEIVKFDDNGNVEKIVNDRPSCVDPALGFFKIQLNDEGPWMNEQDRAQHLIRVGIAQIGSFKTFQRPSRPSSFRLEFDAYLVAHGILDWSGPYGMKRRDALETLFHLENFLVKKKVPGAIWLRKNGHRYPGIPKRKVLFKGLI